MLDPQAILTALILAVAVVAGLLATLAVLRAYWRLTGL